MYLEIRQTKVYLTEVWGVPKRDWKRESIRMQKLLKVCLRIL